MAFPAAMRMRLGACGLVAKVMVAAAQEREDIAPAHWEAASHARCGV